VTLTKPESSVTADDSISQVGSSMSAPQKRWDDHSPRWKREAVKQGLSKQKWDSWLKLSEKSKKIAAPREYAAGKSVAEQRRAKIETDVVEHMQATVGGRIGTVRAGAAIMTSEQLRWTLKASAKQIRHRARTYKVSAGQRNPWWYN
jgi:hypothetical protein